MVIYNGYTVYPAQLRTRSGGYADAGHALEVIKATLKEQLGDGEYLGNDEAARAFRQNYSPLLKSIMKQLDNNAEGLHGIKGGLHQMAAVYERPEHPRTAQA